RSTKPTQPGSSGTTTGSSASSSGAPPSGLGLGLPSLGPKPKPSQSSKPTGGAGEGGGGGGRGRAGGGGGMGSGALGLGLGMGGLPGLGGGGRGEERGGGGERRQAQGRGGSGQGASGRAPDLGGMFEVLGSLGMGGGGMGAGGMGGGGLGPFGGMGALGGLPGMQGVGAPVGLGGLGLAPAAPGGGGGAAAARAAAAAGAAGRGAPQANPVGAMMQHALADPSLSQLMHGFAAGAGGMGGSFGALGGGHHRTDTAAQLLQTGAPPSAVLVAAAKAASIAAAAAATGEEGRRGAGMWGAMERKERQERMRLAAEAVAADEAVVEAYTALLPRDLQARISSDLDAQGVSQVDPLPGIVPVEVAVDSGAARGAASGGAASGGAEPGGAEPGGMEPGGAESEGAGSGGAEPRGAEPKGVESGGAEIEGVDSGGAESGGAEPRGPASSGAAGAGDSAAGDTGAGGVGVTAGAGGTGGAVASGPGELLGLEVLELELESDRARAARPTISFFLATVVTDPSFEFTAAPALVAELADFAVACRLDYATAIVAESESASPPSVKGECALGTYVLEDKHEDFECLAAAVPRFASMLLAPEGDLDAPYILTPRSYAEVITGTYIDALPLPRANIVDGMWIFRVKRPPGSLPPFKARYFARGFSQRQGVDYFQTFSPLLKMTTLWVLLHFAAQHNYELHSLDLSTAFLQGSLHEEIWLRRPPGFTGSFPAGTQWSLQRPVCGLHQAPYEWHDTLRTTLAALGFTPSTADPSMFLRTDTSLPPFYVLVYVDDLVFATSDTEALTLVKLELQKRHSCTDLGELHSYLGLQITRDRAWCTITLTQSHMVHQVLQRFGFQPSSPEPTPLYTRHSL
ncbi:unnamed protein product, partial [Closterium sp. NIES-54]